MSFIPGTETEARKFMTQEKKVLLEVQNLVKEFPADKKGKKVLHAVSDVSFSIAPNHTLGLVGESGCGKSTTGRCILRLHEPTGGRILYEGTDITRIPQKELLTYRQKMQIVFQDPMSSFDGRYTIGKILREPEIILRRLGLSPRWSMEKLMEKVGMNPSALEKYPHEFSGGQRQRIAIARALAMNPEFIVCDEPVSALDVSIQSQILNLFLDLQDQLGLTYLFISHDLSVVKFISHEVGVMYLGKIVEYADTAELFSHPEHPYTQALISAIPATHPRDRGKGTVLSGDVPDPLNPPEGCVFCTRCPYATEKCHREQPEMKKLSDNHYVACHRIG